MNQLSAIRASTSPANKSGTARNTSPAPAKVSSTIVAKSVKCVQWHTTWLVFTDARWHPVWPQRAVAEEAEDEEAELVCFAVSWSSTKKLHTGRWMIRHGRTPRRV